MINGRTEQETTEISTTIMANPIERQLLSYSNSGQWAVDKTEQLAYQYGPVPASAYNNKALLKRYLDFKTVADLESWMSSPLFKPYFDRLYKFAIKPRMRLFPGTSGPALKDINWKQPLKDFWIGSSSQEESVTNPYFSETDHYGHCLYSLCKANKFEPGGCFYGKNIWMKDSDVEVRMWAAIQCAIINRHGAGSKQTKRVEAKSLAQENPLSAIQTPNAPQIQSSVPNSPSTLPNSPRRSPSKANAPLDIESNHPASVKPAANTSTSKKRRFIELDFDGVEVRIEMTRGRVRVNVDEQNRLVSGEFIVGGGGNVEGEERAAAEKVIFKIKRKVDERVGEDHGDSLNND